MSAHPHEDANPFLVKAARDEDIMSSCGLGNFKKLKINCSSAGL